MGRRTRSGLRGELTSLSAANRHSEGVLLAAMLRFESDVDRTDAQSWFMQRLEERERAGIMRLVTEAGAAVPVAAPKPPSH